MDPAAYLAYVHDFDASEFLSPNRPLAQILGALPQQKVIFTNATAAHARNVLSALGLLPYFNLLIGMDEIGFVSKPHPLAYQRCIQLLGVPAERCLFIEDSGRNLLPARALGMLTALVGDPVQGIADFYLDRVEDVARLFGLDGAQAIGL